MPTKERMTTPHGHGQRPDPTTVQDLWKEAKDEEEWWGDLKEDSDITENFMVTSVVIVLDEGNDSFLQLVSA